MPTNFVDGLGIPFSKVSALKKNIIGFNERKLFYPKEAINKIILGTYFFNKSFVNKINSSTPDKPIIFSLKHSSEGRFIDHIINHYADKIYLSGITLDNSELKRSYEKIEFRKIGYNKFERKRTGIVKYF